MYGVWFGFRLPALGGQAVALVHQVPCVDQHVVIGPIGREFHPEVLLECIPAAIVVGDKYIFHGLRLPFLGESAASWLGVWPLSSLPYYIANTVPTFQTHRFFI